jgi:hypothetical protein
VEIHGAIFKKIGGLCSRCASHSEAATKFDG